MIIYHITHKGSGKTYVGQTSQKLARRLSQHRHEAFVGGSTQLIHKAIRKYGWSAFEIDVLEEAEDRDDLDMAERSWIAIYGCMCPSGYNLESGGNANKTLSDETKRTIGDRHRGKKLSPEHVERIRQANLGNRHTLGHSPTQEQRTAHSVRMTGRVISPDHRAALSKPKTDSGRENIARAVRERCSKLTPDQRDEIRTRRLAGEARRVLMEEFRVGASTIKSLTAGLIPTGRPKF